MVDPTNVFAMDDVKFMTGLNVEPVVVAEGSVQQAIAKYYGTSREIELASTAVDEPPNRATAKTDRTAPSLTRISFRSTASTSKQARRKTSKLLKTTKRSISRRCRA